MDEFAADKGYFDVVVEASGSQPGVATALDVAKPRAHIVQLGLGGDISLPMNAVVAKELQDVIEMSHTFLDISTDCPDTF